MVCLDDTLLLPMMLPVNADFAFGDVFLGFDNDAVFNLECCFVKLLLLLELSWFLGGDMSVLVAVVLCWEEL